MSMVCAKHSFFKYLPRAWQSIPFTLFEGMQLAQFCHRKKLVGWVCGNLRTVGASIIAEQKGNFMCSVLVFAAFPACGHFDDQNNVEYVGEVRLWDTSQCRSWGADHIWIYVYANRHMYTCIHRYRKDTFIYIHICIYTCVIVCLFFNICCIPMILGPRLRLDRAAVWGWARPLTHQPW